VLSVAGATLAVMASITRDQAAILVWIVESGEDTVVLAEGPGWATLIAESLNLDVNAADVRELEAQGLIRVARGHVYDLTNAGRAALRGAHEPAAARASRVWVPIEAHRGVIATTGVLTR
jgi:DNA-binding MarR family transcriptional regulator